MLVINLENLRRIAVLAQVWRNNFGAIVYNMLEYRYLRLRHYSGKAQLGRK